MKFKHLAVRHCLKLHDGEFIINFLILSFRQNLRLFNGVDGFIS